MQEQLGIPITAEALCEVAIEKLIEAIGVQEIKKLIVKEFPALAVFFPEVALAGFGGELGTELMDMQPDPYD